MGADARPRQTIMLVSYSDELAQAHSREVRRIVNQQSDYLGFSIAAEKSSVGLWAVQGRRGGLLAGGIQSGATGFGASGLLIIDDPVKDAQEADSAAHRRRVLGEYRSSLATRVHPGATHAPSSRRCFPAFSVKPRMLSSGQDSRREFSPCSSAAECRAETRGTPSALPHFTSLNMTRTHRPLCSSDAITSVASRARSLRRKSSL